MDPLKLNHCRVAVEYGFRKHERTVFQERLNPKMSRRYCNDLTCILLLRGAGGPDSYRLSTQSDYRLYEPREHRCLNVK
jgi:hypothetical protein